MLVIDFPILVLFEKVKLLLVNKAIFICDILNDSPMSFLKEKWLNSIQITHDCPCPVDSHVNAPFDDSLWWLSCGIMTTLA